MSQMISTAKTSLMGFVPEHLEESFIADVLECYEKAGGDLQRFPDVMDVYAFSERYFFLAGCLAAETSNPHQFDHMMKEAGVAVQQAQLFNDLLDDFSGYEYDDWRWEVVEDIMRVLDHYHLSYQHTYAFSPLSPHKIMMDLHNQPIIEVW